MCEEVIFERFTVEILENDVEDVLWMRLECLVLAVYATSHQVF